MSVAYVFAGVMFSFTNLGYGLISEPRWRAIAGGVLILYGLFRITFLVRELKKQSE